jgi:hypothetical protein
VAFVSQSGTRSTVGAAVPPTSYAVLDDHEWALLVKTPADYAGQGFKIWACITQFDAATGSGGFRAQALNKPATSWYISGDNAIFTGDADMLGDFVKDDTVSMSVIGEGPYTYDTTLGGKSTVPWFEVAAITRDGSCGVTL